MWIFFRFGVNLTLEYASEHILNWSPSLEIARVAAGKVSAVKKYFGVHGWAYSQYHLCGCCRPASGHTVRGVSEREPAINQGPRQFHNIN